MTDAGRQLAASTAQARQALEGLARALATADLDGLLRSEGALELAVKRASRGPVSPSDRIALRADAEALRLALARCRTLGDSLQRLVRASLHAQGRSPDYGRGARPQAAPRVQARG
jgi:hypothetical protein